MSSTLSVIEDIKVESSDTAESVMSADSELKEEIISDDGGTTSEEGSYDGFNVWPYRTGMYNYGRQFGYYRPLSPPYKYPIDNHAGPMLIEESCQTFCGVCGTCITLEDEQNLTWPYTPYTPYGGSAPVQPDDAGNREFQKLQAQDTDSDGHYASRRHFGVMPKAGWTGLYRVGMSFYI